MRNCCYYNKEYEEDTLVLRQNSAHCHIKMVNITLLRLGTLMLLALTKIIITVL